MSRCLRAASAHIYGNDTISAIGQVAVSMRGAALGSQGQGKGDQLKKKRAIGADGQRELQSLLAPKDTARDATIFCTPAGGVLDGETVYMSAFPE